MIPPVVSGQGEVARRAEDQVVVYTLGPATAVQGIVRGVEFIAVGNRTPDDLLDMVESAVH